MGGAGVSVVLWDATDRSEGKKGKRKKGGGREVGMEKSDGSEAVGDEIATVAPLGALSQ